MWASDALEACPGCPVTVWISLQLPELYDTHTENEQMLSFSKYLPHKKKVKNQFYFAIVFETEGSDCRCAYWHTQGYAGKAGNAPLKTE